MLDLPYKSEREVSRIVKSFEDYPNIRSMNPLTKIAVGVTIVHPKSDAIIQTVAIACGVSPHTLSKACHVACSQATSLKFAHSDWAP